MDINRDYSSPYSSQAWGEGGNDGLFAAIGAGVGALGGIIGDGMSANSSAMSSKSGSDAAARAWIAQQLYNHPKQQIARLKDAGLNPALMYPSGNSGNASSAPDVVKRQPTDYQGVRSAGNVLSNYQAIRSSEINNSAVLQQIEVAKEEQRNKAADTILKGAQTAGVQSSTATNDFERQRAQDNLGFYVQQQSELARKGKLDNDVTAKQLGYMDANQALQIREGEERILKSMQDRRESGQRISKIEQDKAIGDFELYLNSIGLTKSDPVYARTLGQFIDKARKDPEKRKPVFDKPNKWLINFGKGIFYK